MILGTEAETTGKAPDCKAPAPMQSHDAEAHKPWVRTGTVRVGSGGKMARTIALVSCVRQKLDVPARARELYVSAWFKKASRLADVVADDWFILSAEYGLVGKDDWIAPYEKSLNSMSAAERRVWGHAVLDTLRDVVRANDAVILVAGKRYREQFEWSLQQWGCRVEIPMEGLPIGKQLAWLNRRLREISEGHHEAV